MNNAGWFVNKGLMDTSVEEMDSMLNIFVRAVFAITQRALPSIIENKGVEKSVGRNSILLFTLKNTHAIELTLSKTS